MPAPVLLKLSGEALKGDGDAALDLPTIDRVCAEIIAGRAAGGAAVAIVVGGGNVLRGGSVATKMADPVRGDYMGMLATQINALALRDGFERAGASSRCVGPYAIPNVCEAYDRTRVLAALATEEFVIFGGGTGHPFFTTDTTAALRAAEIQASCLLKGSNVDGIYSADPRKDATATRFDRLSFDEAIAGRYAVMDQTAFALCRERGVPIRVFAMTQPGDLRAALGPNPPGTLVGP